MQYIIFFKDFSTLLIKMLTFAKLVEINFIRRIHDIQHGKINQILI